jgi:hypothetical protein
VFVELLADFVAMRASESLIEYSERDDEDDDDPDDDDPDDDDDDSV